MKFLFSGNHDMDYNNILAFLDGFSEQYALGPLIVQPYALDRVIKEVYHDFPCKNGIENASIFKKAATFVLAFVDAQPIINPLPRDKFPEDLIHINNHQNGLLALLMVFRGMHQASICRPKDEIITLQNEIEIPDHSLIDLVDAISNASLNTHFKMLTLFLEQLAYKTNPDCQYPPKKI